MRTLVVAVLAALVAVADARADTPAPSMARHGMVATSQHYATDIGVDILKHGGNAVDAAVAIEYALAVVHPCCGNLGGGGFAVVHLASGKNTFFNFREKAPEAASADMFLDSKGEQIPNSTQVGYRAVAVPGTVLGLETMLKRYGTMTRKQVMAPAIRLAAQGYVLDAGDVNLMTEKQQFFTAQPNVAAIFLNKGQPWRVGDRPVQTELAQTLTLIERDGAAAFYKGPIAGEIAAASSANGGLLTAKDFADYSVTEGEPLHCRYRGYDIFSAAPPSSGGTTLCEILMVLEGYPVGKMDFNGADSVHVMVEAMRHAFVDRNFQLGDPDFVHNPLDILLSEQHASSIRAAIQPDKATPSDQVAPGRPPHEGMQTTHVSVVDKAGNAVAMTITLNLNYGAKVIAGDTGFFLNNTMDDFTTKPGAPNFFGLIEGKNNAIAPGKRPLSAMTPTIILKDGRLFMVVGSPGGPRIISTVAQTIVNVVDHGMDIQEAIDAPRIHHQWLPDSIYLEPSAISPSVRQQLSAMGYAFSDMDPWSDAEGILVKPERLRNGRTRLVLYGGHDPRRPTSKAAGY